jgi:dehydrogenase/reductase SDR family protein 7B
MTTLQGKTVWLTGASSGIGEALAYELAGRGCRLILSARNEQELRRVQSVCRAPDQHGVVPFDISLYHGLEAAADAVWERYGPIDILINNAGVSQRYTALEGRLDLDAKIMDTNFFGTIALTRPLLKRMVARKSGHIVTISSVLGLYGVQTRTAYAASKHALRGYFQSLRNEIRGSQVMITNIYPGYVTTNVSRNALKADGSAYGKVDAGHAAGIRPEICARKIVKAIEDDKAEVVIAKGKEWLGVVLSRFTPALFRYLSSRSNV